MWAQAFTLPIRTDRNDFNRPRAERQIKTMPKNKIEQAIFWAARVQIPTKRGPNLNKRGPNISLNRNQNKPFLGGNKKGPNSNKKGSKSQPKGSNKFPLRTVGKSSGYLWCCGPPWRPSSRPLLGGSGRVRLECLSHSLICLFRSVSFFLSFFFPCWVFQGNRFHYWTYWNCVLILFWGANKQMADKGSLPGQDENSCYLQVKEPVLLPQRHIWPCPCLGRTKIDGLPFGLPFSRPPRSGFGTLQRKTPFGTPFWWVLRGTQGGRPKFHFWG